MLIQRNSAAATLTFLHGWATAAKAEDNAPQLNLTGVRNVISIWILWDGAAANTVNLIPFSLILFLQSLSLKSADINQLIGQTLSCTSCFSHSLFLSTPSIGFIHLKQAFTFFFLWLLKNSKEDDRRSTQLQRLYSDSFTLGVLEVREETGGGSKTNLRAAPAALMPC